MKNSLMYMAIKEEKRVVFNREDKDISDQITEVTEETVQEYARIRKEMGIKKPILAEVKVSHETNGVTLLTIKIYERSWDMFLIYMICLLSTLGILWINYYL